MIGGRRLKTINGMQQANEDRFDLFPGVERHVVYVDVLSMALLALLPPRHTIIKRADR
jgi:hypothetical protein